MDKARREEILTEMARDTDRMWALMDKRRKAGSRPISMSDLEQFRNQATDAMDSFRALCVAVDAQERECATVHGVAPKVPGTTVSALDIEGIRTSAQRAVDSLDESIRQQMRTDYRTSMSDFEGKALDVTAFLHGLIMGATDVVERENATATAPVPVATPEVPEITWRRQSETMWDVVIGADLWVLENPSGNQWFLSFPNGHRTALRDQVNVRPRAHQIIAGYYVHQASKASETGNGS